MQAVRADFPTDWPYANVYTLADLHIGDPHCDESEVLARVKAVQDDPYGLCILNGDLMNTALRTSVSDVYGEVLSPMQQIAYLVNMLRPIAGKIIGVTAGNHENRVYRNDGIDVTRLVCRELGIEEKYAPEGILIFLRFGTRSAKSGHVNDGRNPRQWYSIYATHGSGGGRKEGAKAIRLADMNAMVDADIFVHSHVHLGMIMKESYYRVDSSNCVVKPVDKLFVCTGAALDYGGYGQAQGFKPASKATPVIHLDAKRKRMSATL
jgi:predicted phosphodiesterase